MEVFSLKRIKVQTTSCKSSNQANQGLFLHLVQYSQNYKSFLNSRYLSEAFRISTGILLPALVLSYFDMLAMGIVLSVGALCVSATDNPGPVHHRRNGMVACNILIFLTAIIIALAVHSPVLLGIILLLLSFIFSMAAVYGARGGSIGLAAILVMILNLQHPLYGRDILMNALYILMGGVWYMLFSLALHRLRPYKLIQQILGDCIQATASYLRTRALFYDKNVAYDENYRHLLQQQVKVQETQTLVSELLFKTRTIVKESTHIGRILVMIYLDIADLFESVMTSYQEYESLHQYFDVTTILEELKEIIMKLSNELDDIGVAVKSGTASHPNETMIPLIKKVRDHFNELRQSYMSAENVEGFLNLGRILGNIEDLSDRIQILHHYTSYDQKLKRKSLQPIDFDTLRDQQRIKPEWFIDNLTLSSSIYRHSLRVSIAVLVGYLISLPLHLGHSYWILLTIVVILKPAYSLTKSRNKDRLIGTFFGIILGVIVLFLIKNNSILFAIMIVFMVSSYFFMRTNYFMNVMLMTPYLVLFFHLLYPNDFKVVLTDRLIDTFIGSVIAFLASMFLMPSWEHSSIRSFMINVLEDNIRYYRAVGAAFIPGSTLLPEAQLPARKRALVALANVSDAFARMLSEPKRHQKGIEHIHRFVVLNHTLSSHIATLSFYLKSMKDPFRSKDIEAVMNDTILYFTISVAVIQHSQVNDALPGKESIRKLNEQSEVLFVKRQQELNEGLIETETKATLIKVKSVVDQFNYIYTIAVDVYKVCKAIEQ